MTKNFQAYITLDKKGLENEYVVIIDGKLFAQGNEIEDMLKDAKKNFPTKTPFVAKVPDERMLVL